MTNEAACTIKGYNPDFNIVTLVGKLEADPVLTGQDDTLLATMLLKTGNGTMTILAHNKMASCCLEYLSANHTIKVDGKLCVSDNGVEINANNITFMDYKEKDNKPC